MRISAIAGLAGIAILAGGAAAADGPALPHQKPGLWQQTMTRDGKVSPFGTSQICLDEATETKLSAVSAQMSGKDCQSMKVSHNLDGTWTVDSICTLGAAGKTASHAVVVGDYSSKTTTTVTATTTNAQVASLNGLHHLVITATRLGPCKAGQRGGDVTMANGMKMNVLDTANAMQPTAPHH